MIFSMYQLILIFFIYSILGWGVEVAFVAITLGNVENRGFLNGPLCPIYGVGMIGVLTVLLPIRNNIFILFLGGLLIATLVELFGGWILDKAFNMRWWDYSNQKYNINGYVCPLFSLMWGIGATFTVLVVHPVIFAFINNIPVVLGYILILLSASLFIVDMTVTLKHLIGIKKSLGQLDKLAQQLEGVGDQIKDVVGNSAITAAEKAEPAMEQMKSAINLSKEKMSVANDIRRQKTDEQIKELEKSLAEYTERFQKHSKHMLNKLPKINKSGKNINIKEYMNSLKRR